MYLSDTGTYERGWVGTMEEIKNFKMRIKTSDLVISTHLKRPSKINLMHSMKC